MLGTPVEVGAKNCRVRCLLFVDKGRMIFHKNSYADGGAFQTCKELDTLFQPPPPGTRISNPFKQSLGPIYSHSNLLYPPRPVHCGAPFVYRLAHSLVLSLRYTRSFARRRQRRRHCGLSPQICPGRGAAQLGPGLPPCVLSEHEDPVFF